jgi:hypothetical protein
VSCAVPRPRPHPHAWEITPKWTQSRAIAGSEMLGMRFASAVRAMQITRRRILDVAMAVAGVMMLVVALLVFDYRTRYMGGADIAAVSEDVNYLAVAFTLVVAQAVRGDFVDTTTLLLFTTTAVVLVVLLMRL